MSWISAIERKLSRETEFPLEACGNIPVIVIRDGCEIDISGCRKLTEYGSERLTLHGGGTAISISGEGLVMADYVSDTVRIRGNVTDIHIENFNG